MPASGKRTAGWHEQNGSAHNKSNNRRDSKSEYQYYGVQRDQPKSVIRETRRQTGERGSNTVIPTRPESANVPTIATDLPTVTTNVPTAVAVIPSTEPSETTNRLPGGSTSTDLECNAIHRFNSEIKPNDARPYLVTKIGDKTLWCLADTGATTSLISQEL